MYDDVLGVAIAADGPTSTTVESATTLAAATTRNRSRTVCREVREPILSVEPRAIAFLRLPRGATIEHLAGMCNGSSGQLRHICDVVDHAVHQVPAAYSSHRNRRPAT
jgi:hypothetical protein